MPTLRVKPPTWALLVGLPVFLTQLTLTVLTTDPGTPLTDDEYETFFSFQKPVWKANHLCQIRLSKGCHDPKIMPLDQFENHGEIPEGPICTDHPENKRFENFCEFAQSRCLSHHFYARRIACPQPQVTEEIIVVSPAPSKSPDTGTSETTSPSPEMRLRTNIDAILKYAFAVSGEEPVTKENRPALENMPEILETTTQENQPEITSAQIVTLATEMFTSDIQKSAGTTGEGSINNTLHQSIHRLIAKAFSLEKSLNANNMPTDAKDQEATSENSTSGSILALDKNAALVILCYSVLQDICIATAVSKAWQEVEAKFFGYGDLVCDNLGRRHTDMCSGCAFCSLKIEQCQGTTNLKRINCEGDTFSDYINPGILAQHKAMVPMITSEEKKYYGIEDYGGLQTDYWCGRLATHGCDDYRIALWLQSEYSSFKGGDFPEKICDSEGIEHPSYCAFKSNQCLEHSFNKKELFRMGCFKNETYKVLNRNEGDDEVLQWSEKFANIIGA